MSTEWNKRYWFNEERHPLLSRLEIEPEMRGALGEDLDTNHGTTLTTSTPAEQDGELFGQEHGVALSLALSLICEFPGRKEAMALWMTVFSNPHFASGCPCRCYETSRIKSAKTSPSPSPCTLLLPATPSPEVSWGSVHNVHPTCSISHPDAPFRCYLSLSESIVCDVYVVSRISSKPDTRTKGNMWRERYI